MKHEMQAVKTALGPWYRPDGSFTSHSHQASSDLPRDAQPSSASTSHRFSFVPDTRFSPPSSVSLQSSSAAHPLPGIVEPDILAPFFPSENEETFLPAFGRPQFDLQSPNPRRPTHHVTSSVSQVQDPSTAYCLYPRPATQNPVAPINLSTTLEGSLSGLRESVVTLAASVDSLGRRNDIALTNETLRLNEEVMSLRANVHGLRMQASLLVGRMWGYHSCGLDIGTRHHDGSERAGDGAGNRLPSGRGRLAGGGSFLLSTGHGPDGAVNNETVDRGLCKCYLMVPK